MDEGRFGSRSTLGLQGSETDPAVSPASLCGFPRIPLLFSSKLTLDFLGGLEQHPVPQGLSKMVCTSQAALTETDYSDHSMAPA